MSDIDKLRALIEAATPGPWDLDADCHAARVNAASAEVLSLVHEDWHSVRQIQADEDNARAIVALRNVAPELLAVVEAARSLNEWNPPSMEARDALGDALIDLDAKLAEVVP